MALTDFILHMAKDSQIGYHKREGTSPIDSKTWQEPGTKTHLHGILYKYLIICYSVRSSLVALLSGLTLFAYQLLNLPGHNK
jgi:hypothetical protein